MGEGTLFLVVAAIVLVVAMVAVIGALLALRGSRRAGVDAARRLADEQGQSLRWMSGQLAESIDRFHGHLAEFGRQMSAAQSATGDAVHQELESFRTSMSAQLNASQHSLEQGLATATESFGKVQNRLGEVKEMAARMGELAGSVHELEAILKVPKLRGLMGEHTLEMLLRQVLPERLWAMQHRFADGRTVDAVVRLSGQLLPVDAKFPLEAYRRLATARDEAERASARRDLLKAVRARVAEIADRYLRPAEGTTEFALMFVPAEGVYAELVAGSEGLAVVLDEALARKVVPVSPATLFAYLSMVAAGMRGLEVEARSREILAMVAGAEQELQLLHEDLTVLGRHLHNACQRHDAVAQRIGRVMERLASVGRDR